MAKEVKIRFNTTAGDSNLKWRVVIDGNEHLASTVDVRVPSTTTQDYIDGVGEKWHVTCTPEVIEWSGDAIILKDRKRSLSHKRHILKSFSYRIYSSCITSLIATVVTGDTRLGFSIGTADFFIKLVTYYIHERIWYHIPFGRSRVKKQK